MSWAPEQDTQLSKQLSDLSRKVVTASLVLLWIFYPTEPAGTPHYASMSPFAFGHLLFTAPACKDSVGTSWPLLTLHCERCWGPAKPTPRSCSNTPPHVFLLTENLSALHRRTWGRGGELRCPVESSMVAMHRRIKEWQKSNPAGLQRVWVCQGSHPQRLLPATLNTGKSEEMVGDQTPVGCWMTPQLEDLPQLSLSTPIPS